MLAQHVVFRYVVAGGTSAVVDLGVLYILNSFLHIQYLVSATLAFLVAFGISFTLHSGWTFKMVTEIAPTRTHRQVILYLCASLFGLGLNTFLMYVFVSRVHLIVIVAQIIVGALVACVTFFISHNVIFKYRKT